MSLNQSRSDRNDSQFRKSGGGRSGIGSGGQHRSFTGGRGRGGGGAAPGPTNTAPPNRSYKKTSNNAQGGQSKGPHGPVNPLDSNTVSAARSVENGAYVQSTSQGVSNAPASTAAAKPADALAQKSSRPLPRAPSTQSSSITSDSTSPSTPAKGDGGKGFSLQFGSISPGFMNGMQVPARTSSAPPNLDEQKRDQARRAAASAVPPIPLPSAPKQEVPKKDAAPTQQPVAPEVHVESKAKRDVQVASVSPPTQPQKPSALPMAGISVPLPFHQSSASMQFGGPNPQMQSQSMVTGSLQMPIQMPLQMGTPSQVPQQVFVPSLQHHLMQTQGIMHQGQNLGFNPQMGPQIPHQLGNMGINMPSQFNQQQATKFGSARKTVKITHPDTHEELRLDNRDGGSSGSRPHHTGPPQSQSLPAYAPTHPLGYYSNSYNAGPPFFPAQSSLPLTSTQGTASSQAPRFNYPISQAPPTMSHMNQSGTNTVSVTTVAASMHGSTSSSGSDYVRDAHHKVPSAQPSTNTATFKAAGGEKVMNSHAVAKVEPPKLVNPALGTSSAQTSSLGTPSAVVTGSTRESKSVPTRMDATNRETITKSTSAAQPGQKGVSGQSDQVNGQGDLTALQDSGDCSKVVSSKSAEANTGHLAEVKHGILEAVQASPISSDAVPDTVHGAGVVTESSSHMSDTAKDQNSLPEKVESEPTVVKERKEELVEGISPDSSMKSEEPDNPSKAEAALGKTDQDGISKDADHVGDVMEAAQGEAEIATSRAEASSLDKTDSISGSDNEAPKSNISENEAASASVNLSDSVVEHERDTTGDRPNSSSGTVSGSNKNTAEANKTKNNRGKKKWKEMLQKADALGTTSDLYMAYKGPEEKKDSNVTLEVNSEIDSKEVSVDAKAGESKRSTEDEQSKPELDDWEDAADLSTPKLQSSDQVGYGDSHHDEDGVAAKKYSRDFLLTFADQCIDLPEGFEITSDIDALLCVNVNASRGDREFSSPVRIVDRPAGAARPDRRGNGTMDADRWNKQGPHPSIREQTLDLAHGTNVMGYRAGTGSTFGVLRHPRGQGPAPAGGILSGPMHSLGFQGMQRNNSDADRWQRATNFNKGLMPPPQTPMQVMHKAEKKYEVGKINDEEQAKQRKLKGILNKLTPQNFEKLFDQVKEVNIDNAVTLTGVISQIFDKALMEPTFCEMYANFCFHLASELPDLSVDNEKITFRRLLLNKCQEEFERGEREEQEANEADGEGEIKQSEEEREEKRLKARRRMLGNIRLIGELYKKRMLTERIMHECIKKLLGQYQNPDEENIEALCKLMSTIGEMIDHPKAKEHMDAYFDIMGQLSNNMKLSSRVRFMLRDAIDLRKNKWQQRRKVEGPKKIEEVHRDAAQERQGQAARLSRGPSLNSAMRRGQPLEFGPRASMLSSPIGQGGGFRGMPSQVRGYGMQDVRVDERNVFDSRTPSVPLPQRLTSDESITLGPQGGLARGMAFRGQPSISSSSLLDSSPSFGDPRRMGGGLNGYSTASERGIYNSSREDHFSRLNSERFGASVAYDQSISHEFSASHSNRDFRHPDRNFDRSRPTTPPVARGSPAQTVSSEKVLSEERLRDMSISAIKEYYSANDEKEVALCIKDLNAPSFYPSVVSTWVTDSFERKDMERDMLAKLLVNLSKHREGIFSPAQLLEGFVSVLTNLEDTVNDAPRAPEFLGRIFGKVVLENVIPLKEVGQLIHEGGEEPGRLLEVGLAADVLGSVLEMIKIEKGEPGLNGIRAASNLRLEDFRPPDPIRSRKLEMFL